MTTTADPRPAGPSSASVEADWSGQNQQHLARAVARVARALARHAGHEPPTGPNGAQVLPADVPFALDRVVDGFGLSEFERDILLLCAGVELDSTVAGLCGDGPTFGLALAALPEAHWSALAPDAPLRRWRLVEVSPHGPLTAATLRVDEYVLHGLTGVVGRDPKLAGVVSSPGDVVETTAGQRPVAHRLAELWRRPDGATPLLVGADRSSRLAVAAHAARDLGVGLAALEAAALPTEPGAREDLARLLERSSLLGSTGYVVEGDASTAQALDGLLASTGAPVVLSASEPPVLPQRRLAVLEVPRPTATEQGDLWRRLRPESSTDELVAAFDLDAAAIRHVAATAGPEPGALWQACRLVDRPDLGAHAQRVESRATWADLVVPGAERATLRLLVAHARHRVRVYEEWGLRQGRDSGLGTTAVFGGPSGTGKTLAAEVVAGDLGLDLYRVDLSAVVSKFIGETEKNLRRVFDAADHGAAVLLFDEADALFGKRTEVKDSHDRYANVEVSYLLQRMEAYRGLAILTTNMTEAIDTAFLRRVRFLVTFPFPDQAMRRELWQRAFPPATPVDRLDLDALATLDLAGGTIRNVAVNAAFLAAEAGSPVRMDHLRQAARVEAAKLGRPLPTLTTGGVR